MGAPLGLARSHRQQRRVRSSAWICDFSSTHSTSAWSGGLRYRPTMSRTLSTNRGSADSLKVSLRCGCSANARQMRCTVEIDSNPWPWPSSACSSGSRPRHRLQCPSPLRNLHPRSCAGPQGEAHRKDLQPGLARSDCATCSQSLASLSSAWPPPCCHARRRMPIRCALAEPEPERCAIDDSEVSSRCSSAVRTNAASGRPLGIERPPASSDTRNPIMFQKLLIQDTSSQRVELRQLIEMVVPVDQHESVLQDQRRDPHVVGGDRVPWARSWR